MVMILVNVYVYVWQSVVVALQRFLDHFRKSGALHCPFVVLRLCTTSESVRQQGTTERFVLFLLAFPVFGVRGSCGTVWTRGLLPLISAVTKKDLQQGNEHKNFSKYKKGLYRSIIIIPKIFLKIKRLYINNIYTRFKGR